MHIERLPIPDPSRVLDYLGRYTHRVAIANSRLLDHEGGQVRFRWKDYRAGSKSKAMVLDAFEFIRRFLQHVLPKGFRRIRHFGFFANAVRAAKLAQIRTALNAEAPSPKAKYADYRDRVAHLTGQRMDVCPCCGGRMADIFVWPSAKRPRKSPIQCDTS